MHSKVWQPKAGGDANPVLGQYQQPAVRVCTQVCSGQTIDVTHGTQSLLIQMCTDMCVCWFSVQGFAGTTQRAASGSGTGATVWGAHPLPQNREVAMMACGDGSVSLWKYQYPDQRKIKVSGGGRSPA